MQAIANYALYMLMAAVLFAAFFKIYVRITPYDEVLLIRQGNNAAALSLSGSLIGFSLTLASNIFHAAGPLSFMAWSAGALTVQILVFFLTNLSLKSAKEHIEADNTAFGGLLGAISLSIGAINAACVS